MTRLQRDRDAAVSEDGCFAEQRCKCTPCRGAGGTGSNLVEGDPSVSSRTPQASVQTAQNIAQGDDATPLETGLRQRGNVESQRAADAKAACDTSLVAANRERRQEQLRLLRSSWSAWEQAWICCLQSR